MTGPLPADYPIRLLFKPSRSPLPATLWCKRLSGRPSILRHPLVAVPLLPARGSVSMRSHLRSPLLYRLSYPVSIQFNIKSLASLRPDRRTSGRTHQRECRVGCRCRRRCMPSLQLDRNLLLHKRLRPERQKRAHACLTALVKKYLTFVLHITYGFGRTERGLGAENGDAGPFAPVGASACG
jgi:hypothetical protein